MLTSNIEILKELKDRGLLRQMVKAGILPIKVEVYAEMYYHVDAQVQMGVKKDFAVCITAASFNVTPRCVYKAMQSLK